MLVKTKKPKKQAELKSITKSQSKPKIKGKRRKKTVKGTSQINIDLKKQGRKINDQRKAAKSASIGSTIEELIEIVEEDETINQEENTSSGEK